ncbi:MAG: UTP--glucose-1-phosphate uridylyltransferase, partial [Termitinemataceae bacterium]
FLLLKMRALLIRALEYRLLTGDHHTAVLPFFQMTSDATDAKLTAAYEDYRHHPLLRDLIRETGIDPTQPLSRKQSLIGALTHSSEGFPRRVFDRAFGQPNRGLALPGGHGENFRVLAPVYRELYRRGIRYVYLGNVDNTGFTIDPVELAYFALQRQGNHTTEKPDAAFEFSWRTPVDVKGGILIEQPTGHLTVGEIGQVISAEVLQEEEKNGAPVLFNCASGLFSLEYLITNLETIQDSLPIRVTDQEKEAGKYAQAEQTTWDIMGLISNPLVFAVQKQKRFIAAKMLLETFLASPCSLVIDQDPDVPESIKTTARMLRQGLKDLLTTTYGFCESSTRGSSFEALSVEALKESIKSKL